MSYSRSELDIKIEKSAIINRDKLMLPEYTPEEVLALARSLKLSLPKFATILGVSYKTFEGWMYRYHKFPNLALKMFALIENDATMLDKLEDPKIMKRVSAKQSETDEK